MAVSTTFLKNVSINLTVQTVLIIASIITVPLLIRTLGLEQYGFLILINTFIGYVLILGNGVTSALIKYAATSLSKAKTTMLSAYFSTAFIANVFLGICGGIILFMGGRLFIEQSAPSLFQITDSVLPSLFFSAIYVFFFFLGNICWAIPQAQQKFEWSMIKDLLIGLVVSIGSVAIAYFGGGVVQILFFYSVISIVFFILFLVISRGISLFSIQSITKEARSHIFSFSSARFVTDVNGQILFQSDKTVLTAKNGLESLSYYAIPVQLVQRATFFIMNIVPAVFPLFAHLQGTRQDILRRSIGKITKGVHIVVMPIYLFLIVYAQPILSIWIGEDFASRATLPLQVLSAAYLLSAFSAIPATLLEAIGQPKVPAIFSTLMAITQVILLLILIPRFALFGAALSLFITFSIWVPMFIVFVYKKMKIHQMKNYALWYVVPFLVSTLVIGLSTFVYPVQSNRTLGFISLCLTFFVTFVLYLISLLILKIVDDEDKMLIYRATDHLKRYILRPWIVHKR